MSGMPWIRFFPSDWLAGTRGMSAAETGIYITLIATMYERGEPVPEDHARLARLCGASNSNFKKVLETLISEDKIQRVDGGLWNGRVGKENEFRSEKSEVGRQAANARWDKKNNKNNGDGDASVMRQPCIRSANQRPDTRKKKETREALPPRPEFLEFWDLYPHRVGKRDAERAFSAALKRVSFTELIAGLRNYAAKTDDRPWCNPSTWLNQDRWADQPAVSGGYAPRQITADPELVTLGPEHPDFKAMARFRGRDPVVGASGKATFKKSEIMEARRTMAGGMQNG